MLAVAALLERRPAILALRRAFPQAGARVLTARSPAHLATLLLRHLCDLIVVGPEVARSPVLEALRHDFPAFPVILYLPLRSDDAKLLVRAHRYRITAVAIEGLDEPAFPRLLATHGLTARRLEELLPLWRRLDLTDPMQRHAWEILIRDAPAGLTTAGLARRLRFQRETVSRRFAAGTAPSLKRAMDAVRLFAAGQLLGNPGYRIEDVARLLRFSSATLLQGTARRTFGVPARRLSSLAAGTVVERLASGGTGPRWR